MNFRTTTTRALLLGSAVLFAAACGEDQQQIPTDAESPIEQVGAANGDAATALAVKKRHGPDLMEIEGVVGHGLGMTDGKPVIRVYLVRGNVQGIPDHVENVPVERVVTGPIIAGTTSRARPAPNGFSIGHPDITAGTFGALVRRTQDNSCHALSNNHVLANSNNANIGDSALQPGPYDGGSDPDDKIGELSDYEPIDFENDNVMDAAIAKFGDAADAVGATPSGAYGSPGTSVTPDELGMAVQKFGRTTGHTHGTIQEIDVTVTVCYAGFIFCTSSATFVDQMSISDGTFSDGGDSGSLIVTDDSNANPVGLLFAGSDTRTIASPIGPVLDRFKAVIETDPTVCSNHSGDGGGDTNSPPTADFTFTTNDLTVDFTDTSSDSDGSIASWSWDFGDGATSTAQNPSHTYGAGGTYTVTLTVADDDGATDSSSQDVTVSSSDTNSPPTADFTFTTTDLTADFTDQSSDSDGSIASWAWDFGDGNTSTAQNPSHTYGAGGTYTVTLTVTDDDGATGSTSQDVSVTEPSTGGITISLSAYKVRGQHTVDVSWSGATSAVDIFRDSNLITTQSGSSGMYTDAIGNRGPGSYDYQVCEDGDPDTCSDVATANF